mmetsp:Transcript_16403/g.37821  ORF Transcript_16403/g.37821 Transcript_16403/m.37821 type:complete len:145 (+) Transcript_16403:1076-1510(+)
MDREVQAILESSSEIGGGSHSGRAAIFQPRTPEPGGRSPVRRVSTAPRLPPGGSVRGAQGGLGSGGEEQGWGHTEVEISRRAEAYEREADGGAQPYFGNSVNAAYEENAYPVSIPDKDSLANYIQQLTAKERRLYAQLGRRLLE